MYILYIDDSMILWYSIKGEYTKKGSGNVAVSKAQQRANAKYNKKAYDRLELKVKKGDKEKIVKRANDLNKSVNTYIKDLINDDTDGMLQE